MSSRVEFEEANPDFPLLAASQAGRVDLVMGAVGWLGDEEQVTTCRALDGDSSTVMRVELQELRGGWRTAVLKQVLPWLARDESVPMPADRGRVERHFYRRVARIPGAAVHMPRLLGGDEARSLLLLEDFRDFSDRTFLYRGGSLGERAAQDLGSFLWALCRGTFGLEDPELVNAGMRALNHRQVFEAPFGLSSAGPEGPGLDPASLDDLEKGLGAAAMAIRSDPVFGDAVADLGRRYLGGGPCLVHGAFHPGNWLLVPDGGVRVIDPQCCGWGDAEFDIGAGLAHLLLAQQSAEVTGVFLTAASGRADDLEAGATDAGEDLVAVDDEDGEGEAADRGDENRVDMELVARYAGVELAGRLIGGRQRPLDADAGVRCALLEMARTAVVSGYLEVLEA